MSRQKSTQQSSGDERVSEAVNRCREILERWQNRFTFQNPAFLKRYLKGEVVLHVHFRSRLLPLDVEYCAVLNNAETVLGIDVCDLHRAIDGSGKACELSGNQGGRVVFVGVIETPDGPKRVTHVECVNALEKVHSIFQPALFFSPKSGFQSIGETGIRGKVVAENMPRTVDCALPELIKRDVQVVDRICGDGAPMGRKILSDQKVKNHVVADIEIRLSDDKLWASIAEVGDLSFEVTDVCIGPFDLDPSAGRPIAHRSASVA